MMDNFTRREFGVTLGVGVAGLILFDLREALAQPFVYPVPDQPLLSLRTPSGSDLLFYGLNLELRNEYLQPQARYDGGIIRPSYLIVQIPALSLHEYAFYSANNMPPGRQSQALPAGPSFLVFELWPEVLPEMRGRASRRRMVCTLAKVLDWEDMTHFRLIAANEPALDVLWPCHSVTTKAPEYSRLTPPSRFDYSYYKWLFGHIFQQNIEPGLMLPVRGKPTKKPVPPFSIFEVPAHSIMGLVLRQLPKPKGDGTAGAYQPYFSTNGNALLSTLARRQSYFERDGHRFRRTVMEILQAEILYGATSRPWTHQPPDIYEKPLPTLSGLLFPSLEPNRRQTQALHEQQTAGAAAPPSIVPTPENFALGLRLLAYLRLPTIGEQPQPCTAPTQPFYLLPGETDQEQLLVLNQLALAPTDCGGPNRCSTGQTDTNFRADHYDIKVTSPFVLGGRGGSFKMHYKNYQTAAIPGNLSLVEYEHHIQDGRDNFIRVAYIGVLAPVDLKAIHVRQAQRVLRAGRSYLEYKEHIELLETSKEFARTATLAPTEQYELFTAVSTVGQITTLAAHPAQRFFTRIEAAFTHTKNIEPMGECSVPFWPREDGSIDSVENLLRLPFQYFDANGRKLDTLSEHPVQFIRREFFGPSNCNELAQQSKLATLLSDPTSAEYLGKRDDGRLRIPLNGQVIALTEDAPASQTTKVAVHDADPRQELNKPNRLHTDWAEYFYHLASPAATGANVFDSAKHMVYPQIRQVKAYLDHVQGVSSQKLPSLLEYHQSYLTMKFEADNKQLLLMLRHTDGFINQHLTDLRGDALKIKDDVTRRYTDLYNGMERIRSVFQQGTERLGGLANPDPVLEHVAGIAQNIALPAQRKLNDASDILGRMRRPLEILNGDAAELLGGIKLVRILTELLADDETPHFLQQKFNAGFDTLTATINGLKNPAVGKALALVQQAQQHVDDLARQLAQAEQALPAFRAQVQQAYANVLAQLPDLEKVKALVLARLDVQRLHFLMENIVPGQQLQAIRLELVHSLSQYVIFTRRLLTGLDKARAEAERSLYQLPAAWLDPTTYQQAIEKLVKQVKSQLISTFLKNSVAEKEFKDFSSAITAATKTLAVAGVSIQLALTKISTTDNDQYKSLSIVVDNLLVLGSTNTSIFSNEQLVAIGYLLRQYDRLSNQLHAQLLIEYPEQESKVQSTLLEWNRVMGLIRVSIQLDIKFYKQQLQQVEQVANDLVRASWLLADEPTQQAVQALLATLLDIYIAAINSADTEQAIRKLATLPDKLNTEFERTRADLWKALMTTPEYSQVLAAYEDASKLVQAKEANLRTIVVDYRQEAEKQARGYLQNFADAFQQEVKDLGGAELQQALAAYEQARRLLQTPIRQDLVYDWQTTGFVNVHLGIIRFIPQQNPPTTLKLHASTSLVVDASQLPAILTKVVARTDTSVTNFTITFLDAIAVDFARLAFVAGSERSPDLDIRIKGVRFEGQLAFFQVLQNILAGLVDAFLPLIQKRKVTISYQSPLFSVAAPGFAFLNISFGVQLELFLDRRPLLITFRLALPESKAMVAAGILGGAFYFSITVSATQGVVQIEMALELGALLAFTLGPINGEVRFMAGLYYHKHDREVVFAGYLIAEGNLKVWIIQVSARLYMGVTGYGSYVEGKCVVSYSIKIGFLKKSFSASYVKTIAGAASQQAGSETGDGPSGPNQLALAKALLVITDVGSSRFAGASASFTNWLAEGPGALTWEDQFQVMNREDFNLFCIAYF